jgi:predicted ABC-type exoprotein transport system permease subunit
VLAAMIGPIAWVILSLVAIWLFSRSKTIEFGLLVTVACFLVALPILGLLSWGRSREERHFEREGRRPCRPHLTCCSASWRCIRS